MTLYLPNYRRARELKAELDELYVELETRGADPSTTLEQLKDIRASIHETLHAIFLTGVESEYDP